MTAVKRKTEHAFADFSESAPITPFSTVSGAVDAEKPWKRTKRPNESQVNKQAQLSSLGLVTASAQFSTVKVSNHTSEFHRCYENQREYLLPLKFSLEDIEYNLVISTDSKSRKKKYIAGSASVVSFYERSPLIKSSYPLDLAVKTSPVFERGMEPVNPESALTELLSGEGKAVNSRWVDEWRIQNKLRKKFEKASDSQRPVVEMFGGVVYEIDRIFQVSIVMEKMDTTLEAAIEKDIVDLDMLHSAAKSLRKLHSAGIIYVDLKPSNILVDIKSGMARFSDFDCSLIVSKKGIQDENAAGSLRYLSPERKNGRLSVSFSDDSWAFGVVLAEVLVGMKIQDTISLVSSGKIEKFLQTNSKFREDAEAEDTLTELILHLLELNPEDRPCLKDVENTLMMLL